VANPSKQRGTSWESAIVAYLQGNGWPLAERRALAGGKDRGDVAGVAGVCIEAKATRQLQLAAFMKETLAEQVNSGARVAVCWLKRRGKASPGDAYVVMTGAQLVELLQEAGYQ
jgi:Holliday junction resolvase